jgi:uncharacterized NAD(P)/FAD-binding protein YdhS
VSPRRRGSVHLASAVTESAGMPGRRVIAVIGAGASGTLTAVHLLRRGGSSVQVVLIDPHEPGLGVAYSTIDPQHLLNVRASCMSAFGSEPRHLLDWCSARGIDAGAQDFLPRRLFGAYLQSLLVRWAESDRCTLIAAAATAIESRPGEVAVRIECSDRRTVIADAAVLALGNAAPAGLAGIGPGTQYVADPWAPGALAQVADAHRAVIVGTGLTAVDIALSGAAARPEIELCAVSRHGWLPRSHLPERPEPRAVTAPAGPVSLEKLVAMISAEVRADPPAWREVVDGLRPISNDVWRRLSLQDRRTFMGELRSWWAIHRHRMAPAIGDQISRLQGSGRLTVQAGRLESARRHGDGARIEIRNGSSSRRFDADLLVNATGPSSRIRDSDDPLVRGLLSSGLAQADELGIGFACDSGGALVDARGLPSRRLFALGPPRRGELLETTAIPEIRAQAENLSRRLLSGPVGQRAPERVRSVAGGG